MARFSAIFCDICQQVIGEAAYSIRLEYRKKRGPVAAREYVDVCNDCGIALVSRLERVLDQTISERRAGQSPQASGR